MALWVLLVAAALLGGCGAAPPPPANPTPSPLPSFWRFLGGGAKNVTSSVGGGELLQRLRFKMAAAVHGARAEAQAVRARVDACGAALEEMWGDLWGRGAAYGTELRAALEQMWGDLWGRGGTLARRLRRRLLRDGEELRRKWGAMGVTWGAAPLITPQEA